MENYWTKALRRRTSRRRMMAASGSLLIGGALLSACGGHEDAEVPPSGAAGNGSTASTATGSGSTGESLIFTPVDRTGEAQKGGALRFGTGEESTTWDPTQSGSQLRGQLHSTLLRSKTAVGEAPVGVYDGNLAETWEISPDRLTLTLKIRPNGHFAPLEPTNGRAVDIEDVKASFDYYEQLGNRNADMFNSLSPGAPVTNVTAPNASTIAIQLSQPDVVIESLLAGSGYITILPKEGINGAFDLRSTARGAGPMYIKEHQASASTTLERNPGYHLDGPFVDGWQVFYIKEYATLQAQFRAGALHWIDDQDLPQLDVLPTKDAVPEIQMIQEDILVDQNQQFFGYRDSPISVFRDERVRQALSMSYDRQLWIETFHNTKGFAERGIDLATRWSTGGITANVQGDWLLDPQDASVMGEEAKYFQYNIEEAKKLLSAAGYPDGVDTESHHVTTSEYGINAPQMIEVLAEMAAEAGIRIQIVPESYTGGFRQEFRDARGEFAGISWARVSLTNYDDPTNRIFAQYHSTGDLFKGFDSKGQVAGTGDPLLDELALRMRGEFDLNERVAIAHEIQKHDARMQYYIRMPGGAEAFSLVWPVVANFGVFSGHEDYVWWHYWLGEA